MFIVMFEFAVKDGFEKQFMESWPLVTQGIYLLKGSLGSRLHRNKNGELIAYAQWPDRETWEEATKIEMTEKYEEERRKMHESLNLELTKIIFEMEIEIDYLQQRVFDV